MDISGQGLMWNARPQLFFNCTVCPTGLRAKKSSHMELSLVFCPVAEAKARRRERVSEARQQAAETIKRCREERGDDCCEPQRSSSQRGRGADNE